MKWEYKTINIMPPLKLSNKHFEAGFKPLMDFELKKAGDEGWELVSCVSYDVGLKFILLFKRPVE